MFRLESLAKLTPLVCAGVIGTSTLLMGQSSAESESRDIVQTGKCLDGRMWFWRIVMSEDGEPQTITTHTCDGSEVSVPVRPKLNVSPENDAIGITVAARTIEISSLYDQPVLVQLFTPFMGQQTGNDWLVQPKTRSSRLLNLGQCIVVVRDAHSNVVLKSLLLLVE